MNKVNYQLKMEEIIRDNCRDGRVPTVLLHSCCAPCSSYCIECLAQYFAVTVFYDNPNIYPEEEYRMRVKEQKRFIGEFPTKHPVAFIEGSYEPARFYEMARGMEELPEGDRRCYACYELRLRDTAKQAKAGGFDYFTTTLSISPMKNAAWLNEIGQRLGQEYGVSYLYSDFKKKNGYKRSTEISREYEMYRQYYCGCVFSKNQRDREIAEKNMQTKESEE